MAYNWQQADWTKFRYDPKEVEDILFEFAELTGHVSGVLQTMPENVEMEVLINTMVVEAIKTSEIEGERLNREDVVSSIRNNLGLNAKPEAIKDKKAQGAGQLMIDVRKTYSDPLTEKKIFEWHKMIMAGNTKINSGRWRKHKEPMQVISGTIGKEKIHFEAPPSSKVPTEMACFFQWFNDSGPGGKNEIKKAPIRSAIAHLYFETIHPFEDGNGRIGRAIAEKALSQTMGRPVLLSLSKTIESEKKSYYSALETAQRSNEITFWIQYFVATILKAQKQANEFVNFILKKSKFFDRFNSLMNERQLKVVKRMLEEEPRGFISGMNASKYMSLTKTSKATATRDLQQLAELGILITQGGGRSTHYLIDLNSVKA